RSLAPACPFAVTDAMTVGPGTGGRGEIPTVPTAPRHSVRFRPGPHCLPFFSRP
ncbi:hypothetical protein GA0115246_114571, partial [Streptomyces sp. SolWspMP-sol7th]